ncbi:gliding motility protein GldL [Algivirga pacifica]|uniref:Gliding motility protein GldL n=1 Tax=Algivirga pacifica TaxID=1162670 RepID=A0ABP9DC14_9BACT
MSYHKETFNEKFNRVWVPKVTAVGAAVVIVGAMFKLEHWPGATYMLVAGLSTEALLFLLGFFAPVPPPEKHYHWEKVYGPAILDANAEMAKVPQAAGNTSMPSLGVDEATAKAFDAGIKQLTTSVKHMTDISSTAAASKEYTNSLQVAAKSATELGKSFGTASTAVTVLADASKDAKNYHEQIQAVSKNLGALNAVYEMELKDANSHLKAMNKFYGNLSVAMQNMSDASKESENFKTEISKLTGNLTQLNGIYGKMLNAMKG